MTQSNENNILMCPVNNCNKQYQQKTRVSKHIEKYHQDNNQDKAAEPSNIQIIEGDQDETDDQLNNEASQGVMDALIEESENAELLNDVEQIESSEDVVLATVEKNPDMIELPDKVYICAMCKVSYTNKGEWEQHTKREHEKEFHVEKEVN